eukprot:TRINITY_DN15408_c0_g1_i1.p1 TRINITY_DN15408_c0_g1~~TRINITY_DN15408_c0_g1_i1.p1  ORF type:complete len:134 (-),score=22.20 TRINITY_DN15408_c0_g1_i1:61-429(-)
MSKVELYYKETLNNLDYKTQNPIIYLATDDPAVYTHATTKYPFCQWLIYNDTFGKISGEIQEHTSVHVLYSVISDVYYLSRSDYLIGTFSSQISRLANEISETVHMDGKRHYASLDHVWYFP